MTQKELKRKKFKRMQARQLAEQRCLKPKLRPKHLRDKKFWYYNVRTERVECQ
jgi:hypothetical protein